MYQYLKYALFSALCVTFIPSCGYDYDSKKVKIHRGENFHSGLNRHYTLKKISSESITIRGVGKDSSYNRKLSTAGRFGKGEPFNLGNNESLQILSVDPVSQSADLQLMWLDSVGFLTMPPF